MFNARRLTAAATAGILAATFMVNTRVAATASSDEAEPGIYSRTLADLNVALAARGSRNVRIDRAEISVTAAGWQGATTIYANDRTHQVESLFVARDPRRGGFPDISYLVDKSDGSALALQGPGVIVLSNAVTEPRIDASMARWQNAPSCPGPAVTKLADDGTDPDLVDGLIFGDASQIGTPRADITHAGWLPAAFFDALAPQGSEFILGVTFTFIFTDDDGNPTDLDHNGRSDTAFREIYYNRAFPWSETAARPGIHIESVVTHEAGHAFGLAHFGKVFEDQNGTLKFAPRAVMNAVYVSPFAELTGTDNASFCQIWAPRK